MKIGSAYPSTFLKADDLQGRKVKVVIEKVEMQEINSGEPEKPVVYFAGKDKGLVLNKTNAVTLQDILGTDETDDWIGKPIVLYSTKVDFQGKRVLAIRVEEAPHSAAPRLQPQRNAR